MLRILRDFFKFSGKRKKNFMLGLFYSIILAIFEVMRIYAISIVVQALVEKNMTSQTLWSSLIVMLISMLGTFIFKDLSVMQQTIGGYMMTADKRIKIGDRLKYMPMGFFSKSSLGRISSVTTSTLETMQEVATRCIMMYVQGILNTLLITIAIFVFNWKIGLIALTGIALFALINVIMQKRAKKLAPKKVARDTFLVGSVLEYVQGISVVKSYNLDKDANQKVDGAIDRTRDINTDMETTFVPFVTLQSIILKLASVLIIFVSISFYLTGTMPLFYCIMMVITSFMIFAQLETTGLYSALLRTVDQCRRKVTEVLDSPIMDEKGKDINPQNKVIEGKNIDFSYEDRKILDNVSFLIPEKTTTAVVGPSGGGKTTLCNLIARFWDVDKGTITIGGSDVREYNLDSLLSNISMVFQNVYLFNDTIENNIKFGKPTATHEEVVAAAKKACCHQFISALPNGYQTVLGESGASISGGEKQRVSIARAIIKDAPIVILDEATSNVDPENEELLQKAITELTKDKTLIMIAHRLKTVENADQILVVDQGQIVQRGTHSQLIKEKGVYQRFINVREEAIGWQIS